MFIAAAIFGLDATVPLPYRFETLEQWCTRWREQENKKQVEVKVVGDDKKQKE